MMKRIITALLILLAYNTYAQNTLDQYKQKIDDSITYKTGAGSITPGNIGGRMKELADLVQGVKDTSMLKGGNTGAIVAGSTNNEATFKSNI